MTGMIFVAAAVLVAAAPAGARPDAAADVAALAPEARGVDGVLQQGRGGGKQEEGGRAQGGRGQRETGGGQGGGRDAAPRAERRQGGGDGPSSRASQRGGGSDRAESGRGRSSSSSSSGETRGNGGSGRSDDVGERRGGSASSAAARGERGAGNGGSSAAADDRGRSDDAARGNGASNAAARGADARGGRGRLSGQDLRTRIDALPPRLRQMAASSRPGERMVAGAVARGHGRGPAPDAFDVRSDGGRLRVLNRSGALLLDLDDDRARRLGGWQLRRLGDRRPAGNAPAFCRSGAGHPVFGREWCLDRGFGLGSRGGTLWSRGGIDDVVWRRRTDDRLDRGGLVDVLGDVVLGRLALQAVALGYDQPLAGVWVARPEGPRLLRVSSGDYEVAELVDTDRDDRVDVLYVVQPVW